MTDTVPKTRGGAFARARERNAAHATAVSTGSAVDALLGAEPAEGVSRATPGGLTQVPVDLIDPSPFNPRRFDEADEDLQKRLAALADSITTVGLLEPIVVRPVGGGRYQLVVGERRWRAHVLAGLPTIEAKVRAMDDAAAVNATVVENLERSDLNPIEEAIGFEHMIRVCGLTAGAVADRIQRDRTYVANRLRLLQLPDTVRTLLEKGGGERGGLSAAHGVALARFKAVPQLVIALAEVAVNDRLSAHDLEREDAPTNYRLRSAGVVKGLWNAPFDWRSTCKTCPLSARFGDYCARPDHYDELEREHIRAAEKTRAAAAKRLAAQVDQKRAVAAKELGEAAAEGATADLASLPKASYAEIDAYSAATCCLAGQCICRQEVTTAGREGMARLVPICTDPARYEKMKRSEALRNGKERRAAANEGLELVAKSVDLIPDASLASLPPRELAIICAWALSSIEKSHAYTDIVQRHFPQVDDAALMRNLTGGMHGKRESWRDLVNLPVAAVIKFTAEAIAREELLFKLEGMMHQQRGVAGAYSRDVKAPWWTDLQPGDQVRRRGSGPIHTVAEINHLGTVVFAGEELGYGQSCSADDLVLVAKAEPSVTRVTPPTADPSHSLPLEPGAIVDDDVDEGALAIYNGPVYDEAGTLIEEGIAGWQDPDEYDQPGTVPASAGAQEAVGPAPAPANPPPAHDTPAVGATVGYRGKTYSVAEVMHDKVRLVRPGATSAGAWIPVDQVAVAGEGP